MPMSFYDNIDNIKNGLGVSKFYIRWKGKKTKQKIKQKKQKKKQSKTSAAKQQQEQIVFTPWQKLFCKKISSIETKRKFDND